MMAIYSSRNTPGFIWKMKNVRQAPLDVKKFKVTRSEQEPPEQYLKMNVVSTRIAKTPQDPAYSMTIQRFDPFK